MLPFEIICAGGGEKNGGQFAIIDSGATRQRRFYDELWDYLKKVEIEEL